MENIDSDLLLNYYFKDGYMFSCPDRLIWDKLPEILSDDPDCVLKEEDRCISSILS